MPLFKGYQTNKVENHEFGFFKDGTSLGDTFVINALIHFAASKVNTFYYYCDERYAETLKCLYQDYPNINIVTDPDMYYMLLNRAKDPLEIVRWEYFVTELSMKRAHWVNWERQIYEYCEVPFSERYKGFRAPLHVEGATELKDRLTDGVEDYIVVHRQMGIEMTARPNYIVTPFNPEGWKEIEILPGQTSNVLQYVELLKGARQIHVVPSGIHQLVDSIMPEIKAELFFHQLRETFLSQLNCKWNGENRWFNVHYPEAFQFKQHPRGQS